MPSKDSLGSFIWTGRYQYGHGVVIQTGLLGHWLSSSLIALHTNLRAVTFLASEAPEDLEIFTRIDCRGEFPRCNLTPAPHNSTSCSKHDACPSQHSHRRQRSMSAASLLQLIRGLIFTLLKPLLDASFRLRLSSPPDSLLLSASPPSCMLSSRRLQPNSSSKSMKACSSGLSGY